jgi:glycosyltransferase involved in cell wall biosynthesis
LHRIAYVIGELGKGGAEYQLHELLRLLDRDRFEPRVFVLAPGGWWVEPIRRLGIVVEELPRRGSADVARLARLRAALARFAPHVLHTILWPGNCYGRLAAIGLGIPIVIAAERNVVPYRRWQIVLERALARTTAAWLVNCEAIADWLTAREHIARERIHVIPNGIDLGRVPPFVPDRRAARVAAGFPAERRLVAQVGRLEPQKDYPTYLRAMQTVAAEVADVDFLVVGEGSLRADLEELAGRLGIAPRVRFTGVRHDVPALFGGVDVAVLTSIFEGFPNVVVEAMAAGAVAVAADVGGCGEVLVDGESGLLVPPRAPDAVAAAVVRVLADPGLAPRLASAARRRVEEHFAIDVMARRTADVYRALLRAKSPTPSIAAA